MTERDIHFKKFSELLAYRIGTYYDFYTPPGMLSGEFVNGLEKLLAQAAYDLVEHVLGNKEFQWYELEELSVKDIPDLTEWPEKPDETG